MRASETALLRSRGAAAPGLAASTALEVAIVAVPAALLGTAAAIATVVIATGRTPEALAAAANAEPRHAAAPHL